MGTDQRSPDADKETVGRSYTVWSASTSVSLTLTCAYRLLRSMLNKGTCSESPFSRQSSRMMNKRKKIYLGGRSNFRKAKTTVVMATRICLVDSFSLKANKKRDECRAFLLTARAQAASNGCRVARWCT